MIEEAEGVITPEIETLMEQLQINTVAGVFQLQDMIEDAKMSAKVCKERADAFSAKAARKTKTADSLKQLQIKIMGMVNQKTIDNGAHKITVYPTAGAVVIDDELSIPDQYKKVKLELTFDEYSKIKENVPLKSVKGTTIVKTDMTEPLKKGELIPGARFVISQAIKVT